jgi:hypothetical protein
VISRASSLRRRDCPISAATVGAGSVTVTAAPPACRQPPHGRP